MRPIQSLARHLPDTADRAAKVEHVAGACQLSGVAARYHYTTTSEEQGA